jgi:hypothetical protein
MTIWLLALILLASVAALGLRQGGIRVAFSLVGILVGALLAGPLGRLLQKPLGAVGLKNPVLLWVLGPLIVFVLISAIFKVAALAVHQKVDVFYKYKAGDLRLALWERLNQRLGLCLGLVNGTLYLMLICTVVYIFSYWTVQVSSEADATSIKILNRLGRDLESSGFIKVARALDPMPEAYYEAGDIGGLIYNNSLLEARLQRYPGFLGLAERPEFQDLANDKEFTEMRQRREPIRVVLNYPKTQAIMNNPDLLRLIWATLIPDLKDVRTFLETGRSPKYEPERILGRWSFDINAAMAAYRKAKPTISSSEMLRMKKWMVSSFEKTSFVAMTDHKALLKNTPPLRFAAPAQPGAAPGVQNVEGQWKRLDSKYQLTLASAELPASVEGDKLTIGAEGLTLAFNRED